ncbi:MAG: Lon protease family protein [Planctomycetota bacterium]|jgi:ATP-dependent Lon protease
MTQSERGGPGGPPPLDPQELRWRCPTESLPFNTTDDVEPAPGVIGQDAAIDALRFGLETRAAGQNVFVRGLMGTGRMTLVRRVLEELRPTSCGSMDRCYVHDFAQPDRPRLVSLPQGEARRFRRLADEMADFIRDDLSRALGAERIRVRKAQIDQVAQDEVQSLLGPFEKALEEAGLALVTLPTGPVGHTVIFPLVDGKPVTPQEYELLHEQGKISQEQVADFYAQREGFEKQLAEIHRQVHDIRRRHAETVGPLLEGEARSILAEFVALIIAEFDQDEVKTFLSEIIDDVVENRLQTLGGEEQEDFTGLYRVNVLLQGTAAETCPIIVENTPTLANLLGAVDRESGPMGTVRSSHMMIRAGSLLRADGGYLILEARDVLVEPGAWKVLMRTLRTGRLEIVPPEMSFPWLAPTLKPEPIDLNVKVVLLGDAGIYYMLDSMDEDFPNLFKVLADFDSVIPRDEQAVSHYTGVLARIAREEKLPPLDRSAVAALAEHGARIAAKGGKLTARFGRVADIAREGAFIATKSGGDHVGGDDIREAIRRTRHRADLPSRRFRELLADGTIRVQTTGSAVGQINGLAVLQAGPLTFGFPARVTATIGPGTAGVINIEGEAALSGAIHTKGFYILGGLTRRLLQTDHPLAFVASIAFEQSYGGIDGDSASGAEICCLLSALTEVPIRQGLAMTGAIDQVGHLLAVGAVNEKIEGFFDTCVDAGTTEPTGVIIPSSNASDLMLRHDVVDACAEGRFDVYAVSTIHEALSLLTGLPAGTRDERGNYPEGSVLGRAVSKAHEYWLKAAPSRPGGSAAQQEGGSEPGGEAPPP